jgi:hypothetical protein
MLISGMMANPKIMRLKVAVDDSHDNNVSNAMVGYGPNDFTPLVEIGCSNEPQKETSL